MCIIESPFFVGKFLSIHIKSISIQRPPPQVGNPYWRTYYFGDNVKRIAKIKAKYDPMDVFGHQQQIEPDPEEVARLASSSTKESEDATGKSSWWAYN